jgi:DNA-binding cell septation regulator SpoVG
MNKRYGKFNYSDYIESWIAVLCLIVFTIIWFFNNFYLYALITLGYSIALLIAVIAPNQERFIMCKHQIRVIRWKKEHFISLPSELTVVISYVDICPPLAKKTAVGNTTHVLKDKYAVTLLQKLPPEEVLIRLHSTYVKHYTTSMMTDLFNSMFIYSFVCDDLLLRNILTDHCCTVIVPDSLMEQVHIDYTCASVHIDNGH